MMPNPADFAWLHIRGLRGAGALRKDCVMNECSSCGEEAPRLLHPPIVRIPRSQVPRFDEGDPSVDWHAPGQGFPGTDAYDVLRYDDMAVYAIPYECSFDDRLCYRCWAGATIPAIVSYLDNQPTELKLNGWHQPEWIEKGIVR